MKIINGIAATLALSASWAMANADATADMAGIRVVGQMIDGTLVLDDSVSGLATWASPGLTMPASETVDSAPTLLVIGHVESWDPKTSVLTVSGQRMTIDAGASIIDVPRDIEAPLTVTNLLWYLQEGRYIAVAGDSYGGGENLATHVIRLDNEAKPGTAPLYVRGALDLVDDIQGIAYMGSMALDLNNASTIGDFPVTGNVVELLAYQANAGSAIVSEYSSLEAVGVGSRGSTVAGISGSGVRGISGSGVKGISGSGIRGISGSGVKGISGSGIRGISGSGVKGISGSGVRGISGSGVKGISGSGVRGISGSGV